MLPTSPEELEGGLVGVLEVVRDERADRRCRPNSTNRSIWPPDPSAHSSTVATLLRVRSPVSRVSPSPLAPPSSTIGLAPGLLEPAQRDQGMSSRCMLGASVEPAMSVSTARPVRAAVRRIGPLARTGRANPVRRGRPCSATDPPPTGAAPPGRGGTAHRHGIRYPEPPACRSRGDAHRGPVRTRPAATGCRGNGGPGTSSVSRARCRAVSRARRRGAPDPPRKKGGGGVRGAPGGRPRACAHRRSHLARTAS